MIAGHEIFPPTRTMPAEEAEFWAQFGCPATLPTQLPAGVVLPRTPLLPPELDAELSAVLSQFKLQDPGIRPHGRPDWKDDFDFQDWVQDGRVIRPPFMACENSDGLIEIKRAAPLPEKWAGVIFFKLGSTWKYKEIPLIYWIQHGTAKSGTPFCFENFRSPLERERSELYSLPLFPWSPGGRWFILQFPGIRTALLSPDGRLVTGYGDAIPSASIEAYAAFHRMKLEAVTHG